LDSAVGPKLSEAKYKGECVVIDVEKFERFLSKNKNNCIQKFVILQKIVDIV